MLCHCTRLHSKHRTCLHTQLAICSCCSRSWKSHSIYDYCLLLIYAVLHYLCIMCCSQGQGGQHGSSGTGSGSGYGSSGTGSGSGTGYGSSGSGSGTGYGSSGTGSGAGYGLTGAGAGTGSGHHTGHHSSGQGQGYNTGQISAQPVHTSEVVCVNLISFTFGDALLVLLAACTS